MTQHILYTELTPREFLQRLEAAPIAYLPLGTLEWHGEHLPLGSDGIQPSALFEELARHVGGIVFPTLFFGPDRQKTVDGKELYGMDCGTMRPAQLQYPDRQLPGSCYWLDDDVFDSFMRSYLKQIARAGFKILVMHGHGPSGRYVIEHQTEFEQQFGLRIFHCWEWGENGTDEELSFQTGHAGKNETSLLMAIRPDLVQMENLGDDLTRFPIGVGPEDPRTSASAEQGKNILKHQISRMQDILKIVLAEIQNLNP